MSEPGFFHFLAQADLVSHGLLLLLVTMSVSCWSLILWKLISLAREARQQRRFRHHYFACSDPTSLSRALQGVTPPASAAGRIARQGLTALQRWHLGSPTWGDATGPDELFDRAMHQQLLLERQQADRGLGVIGTIASSAPFIGLFGTVWGIYHALLAIGMGSGGQASLDQVAGPVGEALVMTAIGLAVAIPASLAYNSFVQLNRRRLTQLEDFCFEFHAFVVTGIHLSPLNHSQPIHATPARSQTHVPSYESGPQPAAG